ncbi:MAG: hypothetical protein AAGB31_02025 [Bdellovibrio sp.]
MKTMNTKLLFLMLAFSFLGVGCGSNSGSDSSVVGSDVITPLDGSTSGSGSNVVTFVPVSLAEFNSYVALHALNAPTNFQLSVNLTNAGSNRYGGTVKISYYDNGMQFVGTFTAGTGTNVKISGLKDNSRLEAEYNHWYLVNGQYNFSGFFQDAYGAIVVVIDEYIDQGDAQGTSTASGSVYYKNFAQSYATQSPYRSCWYIYNGPYDCRSSAVINKSSTVPDGYTKLGTFSGLNVTTAFQ